MSSFLEHMVENDVELAAAVFDETSVEDILAFLAFVDPDQNLDAFDSVDHPALNLLVTLDDDAVDTRFDENDMTDLSDLLKWGIPWVHENLAQASEDLQAWNELLQGNPQTAAAEIALFPHESARRALEDDSDLDWIYDPSEVAVLFAVWGPNDFLDPLARASHDAFEMLSPFAVSVGWFLETDPEISTENLQKIALNPQDASAFQDLFALCFAITDDENGQNALVQACAVAALSERGEEHIAIDGCPGTGSSISDEELARAIALAPDGDPQSETIFLVVDAALRRRGERERGKAGELAGFSVQSLASIAAMVDDSDADRWLTAWNEIDPRSGEYFRRQLGVWLLSPR